MGSDLEARRVSHEISRREMFGQRIGGWEMRLRSMINCEIREPILQLCILGIFQRLILLHIFFPLNTNKNVYFLFYKQLFSL